MKKLFILIVIPFLAYSCGNNENKAKDMVEESESLDAIEMERSAWDNAHLKGEVKMITETPYTPTEDGAVGEMDSCCVEMKEYTDEGYRYKTTEKNKEGETTAVNVAEYSETGQRLTSTWTENGKEVWKRVFNRDEEGHVIEVFDTDSTMQITRRHTPEKFNKYNQALVGKTYMADSTYLGTWAYSYSDGMNTGYSWTDSTGVKLANATAELNDQGWVSKFTEMTVNDEGESKTTVETYTYDSFDEIGNWTQRTEYTDEKPVKVLKRSYSYY